MQQDNDALAYDVCESHVSLVSMIQLPSTTRLHTFGSDQVKVQFPACIPFHVRLNEGLDKVFVPIRQL